MGQTDSLYDNKEETNEEKQVTLELKDVNTPELVIALCSPIGTPVHQVADQLKKLLEHTFSYRCESIRLSEFIREFNETESIPENEFNKIKTLIEKGDEFRERFGTAILAEKAIEKISKFRTTNMNAARKQAHPEKRVAFIIDSIKNQAELEILKFIYRDECYCIGAFAPLTLRVQELTNRKMSDQQAYTLIEIDSGLSAPSEKKEFSQMVQKTFPQSDLFVRLGSRNADILKEKLERFLNLIFGQGVITPTPEESAMFAAASAAVNSGCLSRQVGACVTDENKNIISIGWNDVPAPGGGLYRCDAKDDQRCSKRLENECHNSIEKSGMIKEIIEELLDKKAIDNQRKTIVENILKKSKISSLIEYSRAIHAEMFAIIQAGKFYGSSIERGNLFCTTYPCHNCARHIVAAGILNIYYIEPYSKSLAIKLHDDALTENEDASDNKVKILAFDGVAPNRYLELFKQSDRKDKSTIANSDAEPRKQMSLEAIPTLEKIVVDRLLKRLAQNNEGKQLSTGI